MQSVARYSTIIVSDYQIDYQIKFTREYLTVKISQSMVDVSTM